MKTTILMLVTLLFSTLGYGQGLNKAQFNSLVEDARVRFQKEIKEDFKMASGLENFTLRADFKVSKSKLYNTLGLSEIKSSNLESLNLPGLFVDEDEAYAKELLSKLKPMDIYSSISRLNVSVNYYDPNVPEKSLNKILTKVINNQVISLQDSRINISFELDPSLNTQVNTIEGKLQIIAASLKKPIELGFTKIFENLNQTQLITVVSGILLFTGTFIWMFFRIGTFIKNKDFNINVPGQQKQDSPSTSARFKKSSTGQEDQFKDYVTSLEVLKSTLETEKELTQELFLIASTTEDFELLTILFDTIDKDHKSAFLKNMPDATREKFKSYIASDAVMAYQDDSHLRDRSIKIIKLMKVCAMDPDQFYTIVLNDFCAQIPQEVLGQYLEKASEKEQTYLSQQLEPALISYFIGNQVLDSQLIVDSSEIKFTKSDKVDLLISLGQFTGQSSYQSNSNRLHQVFAYLPSGKEQEFATEIGIDSQFTLSSLYESNKEKAKDFLDLYPFEDLVAVSGCISDEIFSDYKQTLPELLQETVNAEKKVISHRGIELKGQLYMHLKQIQLAKLENEGDLVPEIKAA